jgi:hypothetical protein
MQSRGVALLIAITVARGRSGGSSRRVGTLGKQGSRLFISSGVYCGFFAASILESPGTALDRLAGYGYLTRPHQPEFQDLISNSAFFATRHAKKRRQRTDESHKESSVENDNIRTCRLDHAGIGFFDE